MLRLDANWDTVLQAVSAQGVAGTYTDEDTGIIFATQTIPNGSPLSGYTTGGFTVGLALPADAATVDATEYIGLIVRFSIKRHRIVKLIGDRLVRLQTRRRREADGPDLLMAVV